MLVNRRVFNLKQGRENDAIEFIKSFFVSNPDPHVWRWYTSGIGTFNQFAVEGEFKDLADYDLFWSAFDPGVDFWKKWNDLTKEGGVNEVWQLVINNP